MNERTTPPEPRALDSIPYLASAALVAAALALALVLRAAVGLPDPEMLFLSTVMLTAVWFGRGPSLLASGLGVACYDFFFIDPLLTLDVADRKYVLTFAMMFAVGLVSSELAGRLKRQERDAVAREARTAILYALSRDLASEDEPVRIAGVAAQHAAEAFAAQAVVLRAGADGTLAPIAASPAGAALEPGERDVATWAFEHSALAGFDTDTLPGSRSVGVPLRLGGSSFGVLALVPDDRRAFRSVQRAFLDVFCRQVALAFERSRLAEYGRTSALRAKAEEMRSSLLSAVSHDLRTPLASITGAASSLRDDTNLSLETRGELVRSICNEAVRLERLVANLLDMTRLEAGALALKRDWVPVEEIVGSALTRLEHVLGDRKVSVELDGDLPMIMVDPVLFEQVFINLLENSSRYTPLGTPVEIHARVRADVVLIEVSDHGPGLPPGSEEKAFEKFYRGPHLGLSGAGLGLAICRAIVEAHGGSIGAENRHEGGLVFRIVLPACGVPPPVPVSEGATS